MTSLRLVAVLAMLSGCLHGCGGASLPEKFYTLSAVDSIPAMSLSAPRRIFIGPVSIPDIVNRPQMVLRVSPHRVVIAEQSRWAEPLQSAIGRVVATHLARQLERATVVSERAAADLQVELDVHAIESIPGEGAAVELTWRLKDVTQRKILREGRIDRREPASGKDNEAIVAAHERALNHISRTIAQAVQDL